MKKFIFGLIGIMMMTIATVCNVSCSHERGHNNTTKDSTALQQGIYNYFNPTFGDLNSVYEYRDVMKAEAIEDSVFLAMPETALDQVCSVLIRKQAVLDKTNIVREYLTNQDVYDNLRDYKPSNSVSEQITTIVNTSDSEGNDEGNTTVRSRDTVINGEILTILEKGGSHE